MLVPRQFNSLNIFIWSPDLECRSTTKHNRYEQRDKPPKTIDRKKEADLAQLTHLLNTICRSLKKYAQSD